MTIPSPPRALVTGASSGIGLELARLFAADGIPLVVTARREERLQALADGLARDFGVDVGVIPADLGRPGGAAGLAARLAEEKLAIGWLVNNAGVGAYGAVDEIPPEDTVELVTLNCTALAELTARLLPAMRERGAGRILNVGSVAGFLPGPYMAAYFASKAFVLSFSLALAEELRGTGITVTCLSPGPTPTEFGHRKTLRLRSSRSPLPVPVERVARIGYDAMTAGRRFVVPGSRVRWMARAADWLPRALTARLVAGRQKPAR